MRKKYKYPPITELIIGVYLTEPILNFRAEHVGLYWSRISDEFPNSSQNMMIGNVDIPVPGEIFPLPRFWFISQDDSYLIQVQRNAFLLNWRKRQDKYPHYEPMKIKFDDHYGKFVEFCRENFGISDLPIGQCELAYINMIEDTEYFRSFADIKNIIPSYRPPFIGEHHGEPAEFALRYVYPLDSELPLTVNIQSRRNINTGKETLYFELRSSGILTGHTKPEADTWFDRAHDVIGNAFNNLTSPDIQRDHWQTKDN